MHAILRMMLMSFFGVPLLGGMVLAGSVPAKPDPADWRPSVRWRGFNVLSMFIKGNRPDVAPGQFPFGFGYRNPQEFREDDFQIIEDWGMNFVRIPLDYRYWIKDGDPECFDENAMGYIDRLIELGRRHGIHVQLNFHRAPGYMVARPTSETGDVWNDPKMQRLCAKHWAYFAKRYKDVSNDDLSFNLFNEPPSMDPAKYAKVARIMIDAIRREDPKRFIISDGVGCAPCRELFGIPGVGQALRGYYPQVFLENGKMWPIMPDCPQGLFANRENKSWGRALVLRDVPASTVTLKFGMVSGKVKLAFVGDGRRMGEIVLGAEGQEGAPNWSRVKFVDGAYWQGRYDGTESVRIDRAVKCLTVDVERGDWITVYSMTFRSQDGQSEAVLPFTGIWGRSDNFEQQFVGWKGIESFSPTGGDRSAWRYPENIGKENLFRNRFRQWEEAEKAGVYVMVGEFGVTADVPHEVMMRWLKDELEIWKEHNWGWAVWGLHRDRFGCLDNRRKDVPLEDFRGHKLDRGMLDLLRSY